LVSVQERAFEVPLGSESAAMDNQARLLVVAGMLLTSCACCGRKSIACHRSVGNEVVASVLKLCTTTGSEVRGTANAHPVETSRAAADERAELIKRLTIQEHSSDPEPARLNNVTRMREPLLKRNSTPGPFSDYRDYQKRAISAIPTNLVSYGVSGHEPVQIILPAEYDSKLSRTKATRTTTEIASRAKPGSKAEDLVPDMGMRVRPADIPPMLDAMPDSRYFKRIYILANANPEDDWVSHTYEFKGFISSMAMTDGELNMYKTQRRDDLRGDVLHEWSHGLRYKYWDDNLMKCFNQAVNLERVEWNPSLYATRHEGEQWAVLGERMLGHNAESFLEACENAPVRTALWMRALQKCLDQVPASIASIDHDKYRERQCYVEAQVLPQAVKKLKVMKVEGATEFLRGQAGSILHYFDPAEESTKQSQNEPAPQSSMKANSV
jgi:hypothetical protein